VPRLACVSAPNHRRATPPRGTSPGLLQAEAFFTNQVTITPLMISLPSALGRTREPVEVQLAWEGPAPSPLRAITYRLSHEPSAAMTLSDGW
jgi:hypothetical protein